MKKGTTPWNKCLRGFIHYLPERWASASPGGAVTPFRFPQNPKSFGLCWLTHLWSHRKLASCGKLVMDCCCCCCFRRRWGSSCLGHQAKGNTYKQRRKVLNAPACKQTVHEMIPSAFLLATPPGQVIMMIIHIIRDLSGPQNARTSLGQHLGPLLNEALAAAGFAPQGRPPHNNRRSAASTWTPSGTDAKGRGTSTRLDEALDSCETRSCQSRRRRAASRPSAGASIIDKEPLREDRAAHND